MIEGQAKTATTEEPKLKVSSVLLTATLLILVVSIVCVWFYPSIQDFMASNVMWNGIVKFSSESSATNIDSLDNLPTVVEGTALVAIPYLEYKNRELEQIKNYVNEGGNLLLMDDFGYGNQVLVYLGLEVRFNHQPLLDPLFCYKNQWLPRITDFAASLNGTGVTAIMLNHATVLTNVASEDAFAWSSVASFLDTNQNGSLNQNEPKGPFPVAAKIHFGKGTVAIVSDPSIIISGMLGRDDNDLFIRYLTGISSQPEQILVDRSHLSKVPLDTSKTRLANTREWLSNPYSLAVIMAIIFVIVSRYTLRKGETVGQ